HDVEDAEHEEADDSHREAAVRSEEQEERDQLSGDFVDDNRTGILAGEVNGGAARGPHADADNHSEHERLRGGRPHAQDERADDADGRARGARRDRRIPGPPGGGQDDGKTIHSRTTRVWASRSCSARWSPTRAGRNPMPAASTDGSVSTAR